MRTNSVKLTCSEAAGPGTGMAWQHSALARAPASAAATAAQCPASGKDRRRPLRSPDAGATVTDRLAVVRRRQCGRRRRPETGYHESDSASHCRMPRTMITATVMVTNESRAATVTQDAGSRDGPAGARSQ